MANPSIWDILVDMEAGIPESLGQKTSAESAPVVIASDQSPIPISGTVSIGSGPFAVTQSGTWNINNISGTISLPTGAATETTLSGVSSNLSGVIKSLGGAIGTQALVIGGEDPSGNVAALQTAPDGDILAHLHSAAVVLPDGVSNTMRIPVNETDLGYLAFPMIPYLFNGTTWDRAKGDATNGLLVNLGSNNDVTVTGTVTANQGGSWTVAATQSGTWNITNISGTISLPTGAATETTLSAISAKLSSATSTLSNVTASATSVTILASNSSRKKAVFRNDSTSGCYVKYGATASSTSHTVRLRAGETLIEDGQGLYTGVIDAIWDSATGSMRVTEIT